MGHRYIQWILTLVIACQAVTTQAAEFPTPYNSEKVAGAPGDPAPRGITVPEGFSVDLVAREPDVRQPIHMSFDERGRLWVVENYTYAEGPVRFAKDLRDRVVIFEDKDGDGRFEGRKVFWDQGQRVTSVAVGFGGVYLTAAPYLLFIPDKDRDDIPDGPPQVLLDGFDADAIHHNIVNGLAWGPDGWLYGRHGIMAVSKVGKPGAAPSDRVPVGVGVWRFHPVHRTVQMVARGTTNPWGLDWDDNGEAFFINTVIGHLWHALPGARYRRMYGDDPDRDSYQLMEQTADHFHWDSHEPWTAIRKTGVSDATSRAGGGHAHSGFMIYLGDNWPQRYRGGAFTLNFHGRRINHDQLARKGAGYVGTHQADLMNVPDPWFRGVDLVYGPDGSVYVADWSDTGECHESSGVHRGSGRIYRVRYGAPRGLLARDLGSVPNIELVNLQLHRNDYFVRQARRLLHERAVAGQDMAAAHRALRAMFEGQKDVTRKLRALWALHLTGGAPRAWVSTLTEHDNEHIRVWALRFLTEEPTVPDVAVQRLLVARAGRDRSSFVRVFLASALQQLPVPQRLPLLRALAAQPTADTNLSLMTWYGAAPFVAANGDASVAWALQSRQPLLRQFVARRLSQDIETNPVLVEKLLVGVTGRSAQMQLDVLRGLSEGMQGFRQAPRPAAWTALASRIVKSDVQELRRLSVELGVMFGDFGATEALRALAVDKTGSPPARRSALRALVQRQAVDAPWLINLVADPVTAAEAIAGLSSYDLPQVADVILKAWPQLSEEGRLAAVTTLVSRPAYARLLLQAVADHIVPRQALSAFHARQIMGFGDAPLLRRLTEVWGDLRATNAEKRETIDRLTVALAPARLRGADGDRGRMMYGKTCGPCHKLYGEGGAIGPELTGSNRHDLGFLLGNIVDPSAVVAADYRLSAVHLRDGRVLNGFVGNDTGRTVTVRGVGDPVTIEHSAIAKVETTDSSLMPDGLLEPLSPEEVRDLFAYLMSR